jgi:GrpB-like predicted nucleotidyltransferase (UPF0157 family)
MTRGPNSETRRDEPVRIEPPNPDWPALFEREARELERAIGPWVTGGIHHVGSTAVPGLAAKPVIDIAVGVESLKASRPCIKHLTAIEYVYAPYRADVMHWFCKPDPARRTHHLHLIPTGSERLRDELAFRDHLRTHAEDAAEYESLKRMLAIEHAGDRDAYTEGKSAYVGAITRLARAQRHEKGDLSEPQHVPRF